MLNLQKLYGILMLELPSTTNYKVGIMYNGVLFWGVPNVSKKKHCDELTNQSVYFNGIKKLKNLSALQKN
jgi:hypothetical protein